VTGATKRRWKTCYAEKTMSAHNGDKSRFGRQRKAKINRRIKMRALRKQMAASAKKQG